MTLPRLHRLVRHLMDNRGAASVLLPQKKQGQNGWRQEQERSLWNVGEPRTRFLRPQKCVDGEALMGPVSRPLEWSPHAEAPTLQPLLQDIFHSLPALTRAAATPGGPAEATPASVHCGRTKVFMTDSTVSWAGTRAEMTEASCAQGRGRTG